MIEQRTPEWYAARCGKPTGSNAWKIMFRKKNGNFASERENYMVELIAERLSGSVAEHFTTKDMQRGIDLEPEAMRAYEAERGCILEPGHWVDKIFWGCTPDAFVDDDGLLSVKCPRTTTMVRQRYVNTQLPEEYYWQAVAEMVATDRQWCDLLRYDNRFAKREDQVWIVRINRNPDHCAQFLRELESFSTVLEETMKAKAP